MIRRKFLAFILQMIIIPTILLLWLSGLGLGNVDEPGKAFMLGFIPIIITLIWVVPVSILSDLVTIRLYGVVRLIIALAIHAGLGFLGPYLFDEPTSGNNLGMFGFYASLSYWFLNELVNWGQKSRSNVN